MLIRTISVILRGTKISVILNEAKRSEESRAVEICLFRAVLVKKFEPKMLKEKFLK